MLHGRLIIANSRCYLSLLCFYFAVSFDTLVSYFLLENLVFSYCMTIVRIYCCLLLSNYVGCWRDRLRSRFLLFCCVCILLYLMYVNILYNQNMLLYIAACCYLTILGAEEIITMKPFLLCCVFVFWCILYTLTLYVLLELENLVLSHCNSLRTLGKKRDVYH